MSTNLKKLTGGVIDESSFLKSVQLLKNDKSRSRLFGNDVRSLRDDEIRMLKEQGNVSDNWAAVLVAGDFTPAAIFSSSFYGECRLGRFDGTASGTPGSLGLPQGICRSTVINCEIGSGCALHDAGAVSNCVVMDGAVLANNGSISASGSCSFGNGIEIAVGNETGGREVASFAELTIPVAEAVAKNRADKKLLDEYREFIAQYVERSTAPSGYIGKNAVVRNTGTVEDSFIGDFVSVIGATLVRNSTVLAAPDEKTVIGHGAFVADSCIQWGSEVTSMAIVDKSVLCEHSHVERHGKVTMSILGPNTGVAEGEVTSCLLGPFVGFHHQSMLIAGIWPEGKGNVAYGANIGSNHTSKSPDQEIWCGEGVFFGLGTNIKFPSDFTGAPYSIIATGVDTLPQRIGFPFSLINKPASQAPGVPPSFNEIFPGWVLANNIYSVRRNEGKYRKRNKARRSAFSFEVFRPEIIDMMIGARNALKNAGRVKEIYGEGEIPGLGKNFLTEQSRKNGIDAYDLYIEYYALMKMLDRVTAVGAKPGSPGFEGICEKPSDDREWEHARRVIAAGGYGARGVKKNLERLVAILDIVADDTFRSKQRDDERGVRIIPDYSDVNTLAGADSFIKETLRETAALKSRIESIIGGA